ncbi:MAG: immunity 26/phosphotriesterase HocA family protein [Clostridia bacterium]|nr:immunity 26/phosphotriesterase HocA family protein [Clostridia bacterium]
MFELTNEQRKCFALPPVLNSWRKVEVKKSPHDDFFTYAYLDGKKIVKVIMVSDIPGHDRYREFGVDQILSDDGTKILPKTNKGTPQNFTSSNLIAKTSIGMALLFDSGYVDVVNMTAEQSFYRSCYNSEKLETLNDFSKWVDDWCYNTGEKELSEIIDFSKRTKIHQKFKEGDFFKFRINRSLFGYGRILVDYAKMRKEGIPFWDGFMGKPLCVAVYHLVTEDANVNPAFLVNLKMIPSQMIMDNIFYYGECVIIGNIPISPDEDNFTIHYGRSMDARTANYLYYQCGKTHVALEGEKELYLHEDKIFGGFRYKDIGWSLNIQLPILLECIKKDSNEPYWDMIPAWRANRDLRNPKFKEELKQIKKQMGVQ